MPHTCTNGTAAPGTAPNQSAERCSTCAFRYVLASSQSCQQALTPVVNVTDDADLELLGARGVATAVVGETTYLFVAGYDDDGVGVFSVEAGGALTSVDNVTDDATLELDGALFVTTTVVEGVTYLFVAGYEDDGISVFSVGNDGALTPVQNITDDANLGLDGVSSLTTATVGGATYLFAAGNVDDNVSAFSVGSDGMLTSVDKIDDDLRMVLQGTRSVTTAVVGDTTYLVVAGYVDFGITLFSVEADGTLKYAHHIVDTNETEFGGPNSVHTTAIGDVAYLYVTGYIDDGVSVFSVGGDGALTSVQNVSNAADLLLNGAASTTTAVVGSTTYLFVAGHDASGINLFSVGADGMLTLVSNIPDDANLQLRGTSSVATAEVGGSTYLFVAGRFDSGVSVFLVAQ